MAAVNEPEYRQCPIGRHWVILAPERSLRPMKLEHAEPHHRDSTGRSDCPFCPGMEHDTPGEVYADRDGDRWQLRVVPNKFPAVRLDSPAVGMHEVVIECSAHETTPTRLTESQFQRVFVSYRERMKVHSQNPELAYSAIFKNVGAEAGASLAHLHSQILAMPRVPDMIRREIESGKEYYDKESRCIFCDLIARECAGDRCLFETEHFAVVAPYAPRFAYETWVIPKFHNSQYEAVSEAELLDLAHGMKRFLAVADILLEEPAYNFYLHTGPLRSGNLPHYHWHWEWLPRIARAAGFEWGSGCFINAVRPETAAGELRSLLQ